MQRSAATDFLLTALTDQGQAMTRKVANVMASIFKRGNVWWIHYYVANRSVCRSLHTTHERVALQRKKKYEALDALEQLTTPSKIPIKMILQDFCEFLQGTCTYKSARNDLSYLRQFFGPCCKALELGSRVPQKFRRNRKSLPKIKDKHTHRHIPVGYLEQISAEMISQFIRDRMVVDKIATKTANRIREVLHRLFNYAIAHHGYLFPDPRYSNPVKGVPRMRESAPDITWLNHEEILQQLKVLGDHPQLRTMVATYIYAGLRREEALWLLKSDVDLSNRLIRVRAKEVDGIFWHPKTKRNRSVPISQDLFDILKDYRPPVKSQWFFPGPTGGRWNPDYFSTCLRRINQEAKLSWSSLDFRHTFGTHLAQKGESLYKIAELMGNSPEICRRHYAALIPEVMRDTVEFAKPLRLKQTDCNNTEALLQELLDKIDALEPKEHQKTKPRLRLVRHE